MTMHRIGTRVLAPLAALTTAALLATATPAVAKRREVRTSGQCQGVAVWKMKAKAEVGGIEVEAEVDSNRTGQTWNWSLRHNGAAAGNGSRKTTGRSGSFEVNRVTGNRAGTDTFTFTARRPGTQQICRGTVRF